MMDTFATNITEKLFKVEKLNDIRYAELEERLSDLEHDFYSREDDCCCGECEICQECADEVEETELTYAALEQSYNELVDDYNDLVDYIDLLEDYAANVPEIRNIYYCDEPGKEKTIVIFEDGSKVVKELVGSDVFDLNIGVALCIAEKIYGGKTKYHKMVKKTAKNNQKK